MCVIGHELKRLVPYSLKRHSLPPMRKAYLETNVDVHYFQAASYYKKKTCIVVCIMPYEWCHMRIELDMEKELTCAIHPLAVSHIQACFTI